jgi:hypothetical protein
LIALSHFSWRLVSSCKEIRKGKFYLKRHKTQCNKMQYFSKNDIRKVTQYLRITNNQCYNYFFENENNLLFHLFNRFILKYYFKYMF